MKIYFTIVLLFFLGFNHLETRAQQYYWVAFSDKNNAEFSLDNPWEYLSDRAIARRVKQKIPIDSLDLPVNSNYISQVLNLGVELVHSSKWLNGITIKSEIDSFETKVSALPFVTEVQLSKDTVKTSKQQAKNITEKSALVKEPIDTTIYGASVYQTGLMNGQFLHNQNYRGQGIHMAILDGGFLNANEYQAFDSLWANNQILGTKDFVDPQEDFYKTNYHGMSVLSCIGGNVPGELIGTATKAKFWLIRSEDTSSEYIIEEDNWVAAAEFADSAGVDIINSSLGYYEFWDARTDHSYADMDGKTTRVTQGANIAVSKGMLVFSSAGNEGAVEWKYIIAPSDGENVIGVGATNKFGFAAPFTSHGPAYGGMVKPNVSGVGWNTYLQKSTGLLGFSSGTSFSSPVLAGMTACLWQAVPNASAMEVKWALEQSAHLYDKPDTLLGYGIPDFKKAWLYLINLNTPENELQEEWLVYPNPVTDFLVIEKAGLMDGSETKVEVFNLNGQRIRSKHSASQSRLVFENLSELPDGIFFVRIGSNGHSETKKICKISF